MTRIELIEEYYNDVINMKMSIHAYALACKAVVAGVEQEQIDLKEEYDRMYYKFGCVIDNATGSRASKPEIDKEVIYSLINENVSGWMQMAIDEYKEYESEPKTCETCVTHNYPNSECDLLRYLPEHYRNGFGCIHHKSKG